MKYIFASLAIFLYLTTLNFDAKSQKQNNTNMQIKTLEDSVGYSLGVNIGLNIKQQGFSSINIDAFAQALRDVYGNQQLQISQQEAGDILQNYFQKIQESKFSVNKEEGAKFLETNGKRKEVITLSSGLQYEVIKTGTGPKPGLTDKVTTHYHGTFINGEVFDSSKLRNQPATFPVNGVIKGWTEALQLMNTGSIWKLYLPYNLAYGEQGAGESIPPFTTLIFEVELISIQK